MPINPGGLHDFLRTRRSIRRYKADPVSPAVIERILTTATFAPSAHNLQPWRFCVVTDSSTRMRLGEALTASMRVDTLSAGASEGDIEKRISTSLRRLKDTPVVILLCRDTTAVRTDAPEEITMNIQSTALAGLQLLLAAHAEGLGGNWICWPLYTQSVTHAALELPETWEPQGMFFIGSPAESPSTPDKKKLGQIVLWR